MTNLSIFNQLRPFSVGFDDMFDHFDSMVSMAPSNYPPYNIVKTDNNNYNVEIALAGFSKKDITVEVENGILTIESIKTKDEKEVEKILAEVDTSGSYFVGNFAQRDMLLRDDMNIHSQKLNRSRLDTHASSRSSPPRRTCDPKNGPAV